MTVSDFKLPISKARFYRTHSFSIAEQNIFRVFRLGQKRICYIYRLISMGTMEEKVYSRSVTKQAMSCRVVDEQQIDRHYNMAELTELYM